MARKTRSAADIARSRARTGRTSLRRSEPPKRNRKKERKKDRASTPPRRARSRKPTKKKAPPKKKAAPRTRNLAQPRRGGRGFGRLILLVLLMMGLGFGLVWGLDAWARLSRPAPAARVEPEPAAEAAPEEESVGFAQLWEKFVDRLLDRDLPVKRQKPILPAARKPQPKPTPPPAPPPAPDKPDPSGRAENPAPPPTDYQQASQPLEEAVERRAKREQTRRERLDKLFDQVGLDR